MTLTHSAKNLIARDELEQEYRELYWFINELQLCGATDSLEYRTADNRRNAIVAALGFTPEA